MNFKGYGVDQAEVFATLANTDLFEQIEVGDRSSNNSERSNPGKATNNQNIGSYSSQRRKFLKRHC